MEYYVNNKGVNFVVRRVAANGNANDYEVKMEMQSVANPDNAATLVAGVAEFKRNWDPNNASTYELVTNSTDPNYLMLVYKTLSQNDSEAGIQVGDVFEKDEWGLVAYDNTGNMLTSGDEPVQFNWEYRTDDDNWGGQTYLHDGTRYVLLDDPIMLDPVELTSLGGTSGTYSLQFDGWMHGLPDMHWELEKNDYLLTNDLKTRL
jgi:hypothetical protein